MIAGIDEVGEHEVGAGARRGEIDGRRVFGRRLEQAGEHRRLGEVDVGDLLAEIVFGRRRDAEIAAAHIGAVEIELEDLVLGVVPLEPDGEEGFLDLALDGALGAEEQVLGQLLGDRGAALRAVVALRVVDQRRAACRSRRRRNGRKSAGLRWRCAALTK